MTIEIHLETYTLDTEISRNEWSTFYRARRKADDAPIAVRLVVPLFATDEFFVRRFINITQQCVEFEHPNIWPLQEAEQAEGYLYWVQDWIEARPLAEVIAAEGPFPIRRTQFIAAQIASALDYVHQKSMTHGDLSAHQIYVGADDHIWITNFGLSQLLYGTNFTKHGLPDHAAETLAPERVRGQGPSRQADLYSLGVLCYQMLSKKLPFTGPPSMVLHAQAYKQPQPLHQANPGIPLAVSETVERMLSKSVDVRYNTGAEFARALLMAYQRKKSFRSYDRLLPLVEREARRPVASRSVLYSFAGLVLVLAVVLLSVWAGYELGLKHSLAGTSFPQSVLSSVLSTPSPVSPAATLTPEMTPTPDPLASPPATPTLESLVVLSDSLRPTPTSVRVINIRAAITPTLTTSPSPTPTFPNLVPLAWLKTPTATPEPAIPNNQGKFVFYNPTGYDLIIDLTGPTNASVVVPPLLQKEIALSLGEYQYIIHTPSGQELETKVGTFTLSGGEVIQKDYYSEHDFTLPHN